MVEQIEQANRYTLANRYVFTGTLFMETAFHIGGGRTTLSSSNSPVVLTPEELPFIPGSSFKGALRSTVEKLVPNFPGDWSTCALIELSDAEAEAARALTNKEEIEEARKQGKFCPTAWDKDIADKRRKTPARAKDIYEEARENLCDTCRLFGSPFAASHINVSDLYISNKDWGGIIQIRDGVAIDRDSEKAKDGLKYDFEVVPASASFDLTITLENASERDLQLLCVGLSEFVNGFGVIGGKRSRGLGVCKLNNLHVSELRLIGKDFDGTAIDQQKRSERLRDYLLGRKYSCEYAGNDFLGKQINSIFE
jgi:CRISPR-associated RAMP protein (TIGR02581 family)